MAARGREGFTLLEVMAAVAVLAIALVALLEAQARSIRASHDIQLKTQAVLLAQEKMTQLELLQSEGDLPTGDDGAAFEEVPPFRWETSVADRDELPDLPVVFREVTVRILWPVGVDDAGKPVNRVYAVTQLYPRLSGDITSLVGVPPPESAP